MREFLIVALYFFVGGVVAGIFYALSVWPNRHTPTNLSDEDKCALFGIACIWPFVLFCLIGYSGFKLSYKVFLKFETKGIF